MKQFLVHFDDSPRAVQRLQLARRLAALHSASVTALYAVTPVLLAAPMAIEAGAAAVEALRDADARRVGAAKGAFDAALAGEPGVHAHWAEVTGYPVPAAFGEQSLYADLVFLGQRDPDLAAAAGADDMVQAVVVAAGRPAIVLPFTGPAGSDARRIAIAWKPTREAARAIAAAEPLLQKADRVDVLAWGDPEDAVRGARLDLAGWLAQRGIDATWHREGGPEPDFMGERLLSRTFDLGTDLLVMGCYGHSRAREFVFGGATRSILHEMTVPVVMAH